MHVYRPEDNFGVFFSSSLLKQILSHCFCYSILCTLDEVVHEHPGNYLVSVSHLAIDVWGYRRIPPHLWPKLGTRKCGDRMANVKSVRWRLA